MTNPSNMTFRDLPIFKDELDEFKIAAFLGDQVVYIRGLFDAEPTKDHIPILVSKSIERGTYNVRTSVIAISELNDDRQTMFYNVGRFHGATDIPIVVAFFSEAWMSKAPEKGEEYIRPSEHPDKVEAMMFSLMTIEQKSIGALYAIDRDNNGNMKLGKNLMEGPDVLIENNLLRQFFAGAMSHLMPKV